MHDEYRSAVSATSIVSRRVYLLIAAIFVAMAALTTSVFMSTSPERVRSDPFYGAEGRAHERRMDHIEEHISDLEARIKWLERRRSVRPPKEEGGLLYR